MSFHSDGKPQIHPTTDHRGSLATAIRDVASVVPYPGLITILDKTSEPLTSALGAGTQVVIDDWVDLAEWCVLLSSYACHLDVWIEKQVNGEWVPTDAPNDGTGNPYGYPGEPAADPEGYTVNYNFLGDDLTTDAASLPTQGGVSVGAKTGRDPELSTGETWSEPDTYTISRLRVIATADCSSGEHDAKGYRVRMRVRVEDTCIYSKEVAIPAGDGVLFLDEPLLSLADLGVTTDTHGLVAIALIRRNGKTIRVADSRQSLTDETLDPPAPPIVPLLRVVTDGVPWYNLQNGYNSLVREATLFGGGADPTPNQPQTGGSRLGSVFAGCTEYIHTTFKIAAWRSGAMPTEYVAQYGGAPVPVPAGSDENCTLLIKLFRSAPWRRGAYPFTQASLDMALLIPPRHPDWTHSVPAKYRPSPRGLFVNERVYHNQRALAYLTDAPAVSAEIVGDGNPQATAHGLTDVNGLPVAPSAVAVVPVKWPVGSACDSGTPTADETNVTVTMTAGVTYRILIWGPAPP